MVDSYPTPYDRAKALLAEFVEFAEARSIDLPEVRYAQIGEIVRDCESVIVSVGNIAPDPLYDPLTCVAPRTSTFLVDIIRSCAIVYDNEGLTIPSSLEEVSERGAIDGQLLDDFAREVEGWTSKSPWSVVWSLAGANIQVASLQITVGVP